MTPEQSNPLPAAPATSWTLEWDGGRAEVQALGAMLGPLEFRLDDGRALQVMHVAPWAGSAGTPDLPGILRRLRGEWPCIPFGRTDLPPDLPPGWEALVPDDAWPHGYGANHAWTCDHADAHRLSLSIDYPLDAAVARLERHLHTVPGAAAIDIELVVHPRRTVDLPAGLHPTFRLQPDGQAAASRRVQVELGAHEGIFSYPSRSAGAISRLLPDSRAEALRAMPADGGPLDLSCLPLETATEALLQVRAPRQGAATAPFSLHYLDEDARVGLWWDTCQFRDLMLWVSNRGRPEFPWDGRHVALGAEPVNSVFDLGRVARPPAGHPLADRLGIALQAGQTWRTRYRIGAWRNATGPRFAAGADA
jgi:hypothetical protein